MPRAIFPPFQHQSGATELEHALDAKRLDDAFKTLANTLNGGIDETNLNSTVKFSTVTPGGVNVGTALATKYGIVVVSGAGTKTGTDISYTLGYSPGWVFRSGRFKFNFLKANRATLTIGATTIFDVTSDAATGSPFSSCAVWPGATSSIPGEYSYTDGSPAAKTGDIVLRLRYGSSAPMAYSAALVFAVPVL